MAKQKQRKPPITHSLFDVLFIERVFTVPKKCPHCKTDLTEYGAVKEWNWQDCSVRSHLDTDAGIVDPEGDTEYGDTFYPCAIWCTKCSKPVVSAAQGTLTESPTAPVSGARLMAVLTEGRGEEDQG